MQSSHRLLLAGLVAGALLRALLMPLPGTGDVAIWKVWSFAATSDVTGMYGVGGHPEPERRLLRWQGDAMTVDYPPVALYELALAGRVYQFFRPLFDDSVWLNVAVKAPGLVAELVLIAFVLGWLRPRIGEAAAGWLALALWLNPAVLINGAALGYLDLQMAVPLAIATVLAWRGHAIPAGVLISVAVLTKAQALFAAPAIMAILGWRSRSLRTLATCAAAGLATTAVLVAPFVLRGAWPNMIQALGRLATHDTLSAQAANVWWITTWLLRVVAVWPDWSAWQALTLENRILGIPRAVEMGLPNARILGLVLVALAVAWACVRARRAWALAESSALAAWCLWAYALLAAQVHENHLAAAIFLLAPAAAVDRRYRTVYWWLSAVVALNLYLFYGLGRGWPPIVSRRATIVDATVLLSVVNVLAFAGLTIRLVLQTSSPGRWQARS